MFNKLGSLIVAKSKLIFAIYLIAVILAGGIGSAVFGKLDSGGYSDPKSDSAKAFTYLTDVFKVKDPAVVLVIETKGKKYDSFLYAPDRDYEELTEAIAIIKKHLLV